MQTRASLAGCKQTGKGRILAHWDESHRREFRERSRSAGAWWHGHELVSVRRVNHESKKHSLDHFTPSMHGRGGGSCADGGDLALYRRRNGTRHSKPTAMQTKLVGS